jgi:5-methylcytosine-specific restriction endonuclease McrA
MCEKCGKHPATEVHHLAHQSDANDDGIIVNCDGIFHKNSLSNLMSICEDCHNETHKTTKKGARRVKTTKGFIVKEN